MRGFAFSFLFWLIQVVYADLVDFGIENDDGERVGGIMRSGMGRESERWVRVGFKVRIWWWRLLPEMNSVAVRLVKHFRASALSSSSSHAGVHISGTLRYSTLESEPENNGDHPSQHNDVPNKGELDEELEDFLGEKPDLQLQSVDPKKGWGFRGVHKAIICGKVGQSPIQKILRSGKNVTIFTVGTGGMYDQRIVGAKDLPKPAQWHRIAVHSETLGAYAVQKIFKNSSVYVEGDIETRVYNDSISGEVKSIPEICVRRDGKIRLLKGGESIDKTSLDDLREGLF
ncbi:hypothetical protein RJT34_23002 [Clitoria ternatea]|uniref:Single-stranded DNA-binding protein, mitochondrial n=1 Tax=Clitoria ternatea TaxID=43366 RepID=A0AAN9FNA3_CLITE